MNAGRCLVTGAGGFVGTSLVKALAARNFDVMSMSRAELDVTRVPDWLQALRGVEVVYHLAAHETPNVASTADDWQVNAGWVFNLAAACRDLERKPFVVFASSTNLVGCPSQNPITERTLDSPLTVYAIHKRTAEDYLAYCAREFGIPSVTMRLPNLYGVVGNRVVENRMVVNRLASMALRGEALTIYANGACIRDFLHVEDASTALLAAADLRLEGEARRFVLGSGEGTRVEDAVTFIAATAGQLEGREVPVTVDRSKILAPVEWRNVVVDFSAFNAATRWAPTIDFKTGVKRTIEHLRGARA